MINEDYCSYEVAKLFKEKGFDELCFRLIREDGDIVEAPSQAWNGMTKKQKAQFYLCPTHQTAMKWLRGKHIIIVVQPKYFNGGSECSYWGVDIWADDNYEELQGDFPAYEQAVEAAIKYCLENLI